MKKSASRIPQILKFAAAMSVLGMSSSVFAVSTWTFGSGNCQPVVANCAAASTDEASAAKVTAVSAYATTGNSGTTFAAATLTDQDGNGLGITAAGEATGSPNHAMDNNGATELMVFKFDKDVIIDKVVLGWTNTDADISLLRWTGSGDPLAALSGKTVSNLTSVANTWSLVGHYDSVAAGDTDITVNVNPNGVSSSWWIISAYNSGYGGTALTNSTSSDYMKVLSIISQNAVTPPGNRVPEPGSLALIGAGFVGLVVSRRKQRHQHAAQA